MPDKVNLVALIDHLGRGGSERQLFLSMVNLNRDQFKRHIVVFHPSPGAVYNEDLADAGVKIWSLPGSYQSIQKRLHYVVGVLREANADIVHSWTIHDNPFAGIAGRLARVPVRWGSVRGSLNLTGFKTLPSYYRYASLHLVSCLVVNALSLQSELLLKGIKKERILLLPNMVSAAPQSNPVIDLSIFGFHRDNRVIGTVGNLRKVKNQQLFIEAVADVIAIHPDVRGLIIGQKIEDEEQMPVQLQARIDELGMNGRIVLAGFQENIAGLMQRFDFFCLTSRSEGTPNTVLEAMAVGCPVVATSVGGIPDLVQHDKNGILVPSEDRSAVRQAVLMLLENPDRAKMLRQEARLFVKEHHGCQPITRQLGESYYRALGR